MAGIKMTPTQRSKLLEALLQQQSTQDTSSQTLGEALLRIGESFIRGKQIKNIQGEEKQAQDQLVKALQPGMQMEQIEGGPPALDPIRAKGPDGQGGGLLPYGEKEMSLFSDAISKLPIEHQAAAAQIVNMRKEMQDPSAFQGQVQLKKMDQTYGTAERKDSEAFTLERDEKLHGYDKEVRGLIFDHDKDMADLNQQFTRINQDMQFEHEDLQQVRSIQSAFDLARLEGEMAQKASGMGLKEIEGKNMGWASSFGQGMITMQDQLAGTGAFEGQPGYSPDLEDAYVFAKAIDEETGTLSQEFLKRHLSPEAQAYWQSAYMMIDPIVRQRSGAAVRPFEFMIQVNSLIPHNKDSDQSRNQKLIAQRNTFDVMYEASGNGQRVVRNNIDRANRMLRGQDAQTPDIFAATPEEEDELRRQAASIIDQEGY